MKKSIIFLSAILFSTLLFGEIFLNGVKAEGLTNQEFKNCTVRFDANGNLHITAPGIKIIQEEKQRRPTETYYISIDTEKLIGNSLELFINGKRVEIKGDDSPTLMNISAYLVSGENSLALMAPPQKRESSLHLIVGTGKKGNNAISIEPIIDRNEKFADKGLQLTVKVTTE